LWREREKLKELNADVLLVSFEPLARITWYLGEAEFGWPVLSDPGRRLYRAYGMEQGSLRRAWLSPRTILYYARALVHGRLPRLPRADSRQLGGDVLIDPDGMVRYLFRSAEPADRPPVEELLRLARDLSGGGRGEH